MLTRHGVRLTPKKAAILDMIEDVSKARGGIEITTLAWVFYPGVADTVRRRRVSVHINQLNDLLASSDVRIVTTQRGLYRLNGAA